MNDSRKISYQSLKEKLSDEKLKRIIAGSGGESGNGPYYISCKKNQKTTVSFCWPSCSGANCPSDHDGYNCTKACID